MGDSDGDSSSQISQQILLQIASVHARRKTAKNSETHPLSSALTGIRSMCVGD